MSKTSIYQDLKDKKKKLAVVGLGYVGLPVALEFARKFSVIGFDINPDRVAMMKNNIDPSNELDTEEFEGCDIEFTHKIEDLKDASFYVVAVPTPVDKHKVPDLKYLQSASEFVGKVLEKGDYVVYESTVYPGCTEGDCLPILEKLSGLKNIADFKIGYSPERINPGDKVHTISKITKVVSGCDHEALENIADVYGDIIDAGIHKATTIKVAEAAKIIENTQRDLNIALMNELSIIFDKMDINTWDVIEAASTKWNFLRFYPGLVGGHCIGVDPYYLTYKSIAMGYEPEVILNGRRVNDLMSTHVAKKAVQMIIKSGKRIDEAKVLVMGATFKENVSDIRNSKVADLVTEIESFSVNVDLADPYASNDEMEHEYGIGLVDKIGTNYDCIIVAVAHDEYKTLGEDYFNSISNENGIFMDIKGIYKDKINQLQYWSL